MRGIRKYRPIRNPGRSRKTDRWLMKGVYEGGKKRMRMYRKGTQAVKKLFRSRFNKSKYSKWINKYK